MALVIRKLVQTEAPLILLYGTEGIGKTSLALDAPSPLYIPIGSERPPRNITPEAVEGINSFIDILEALRYVYKNPGDYQTIVLDSATSIEPLVWEETCIRRKWADIETPSYGKGYLAADEIWGEILSGCRALAKNRGITVFILCHSQIEKVDEPGTPPFNKHSIRLQQRGENLLTSSVDAVLFMYAKPVTKAVDVGFNKKITHAEGGGVRYLAADGRAHFTAKSRLGLPAELLIPEAQPFSVLAPYLLPPTPETALETPITAPTEALAPRSVALSPAVETPPSPTNKPPLTIPADPAFVEGSLPKTNTETSEKVLDGDNFPEAFTEGQAKGEADGKTN